MLISSDDAFRVVLLAAGGAGAYFSRRNHTDIQTNRSAIQEVRVIVNGRTDRMQKYIEELTALLVSHGIDVPGIETPSIPVQTGDTDAH